MNTLGVYVTAQRWMHPLMEALQGHATGVILGDLFCQKRMFENEWFDTVDLAQLAREIGFQVVFQSPMYNTTRTMETTMSLLRKLHEHALVDAVLVHDIGVLQELNGWENIELWWDRFSFNRDFVPNAYLIDFLMEHGVSQVEVVRPTHIHDVSERGCGVLMYGYGPNTASFGRICYTEYFLDEPCGRKILCSRRQPFITSVDKVPLQYMADGYTLLDKDNPVHTLPRINTDQAVKIHGITTYIRGKEREIKLLDDIAASISALRIDAQQPISD